MSAFLDKSALDVAVLSLVLSLVLPAYDRTIRTIRQAAGELRGTDLEVDGLLMILAGELRRLPSAADIALCAKETSSSLRRARVVAEKVTEAQDMLQNAASTSRLAFLRELVLHIVKARTGQPATHLKRATEVLTHCIKVVLDEAERERRANSAASPQP